MAKRANLAPSEWVGRYGDFLFRYAMLRLRDRSAAEDMVQETFLAALYERQILLIRETARRLAATVDAPGESFGDTLSEEARERIRESILPQ